MTSLLAPFAETVDLQAFNALMIGLCAWISLHQFSPFSEVFLRADVKINTRRDVRVVEGATLEKSCS